MNQLTAHALVADSIELFSLPDIYYQVSEMINDPRFTLEDIGQVISKDVALSARLLKIVNSSFYGFQAKIDTISRAIVVVGIEDLKNLILATSVVDNFTDIPSDLVDMTDFWMHSIHCGVMCKLLAKASLVLHCERLFLTGLLHNIGSLVLYCKMPRESQKVLLAVDNDRHKIAAMEQEIIGFNHADVGSELIKRWDMPESLYEAIACYPTPQLAQVYKLDAYLLSIAVKLANAAERGKGFDEIVENLPEAGLAMIRLTREQVIAVANLAANEYSQIFALMAPSKRFH
ncbi:HDOD domain-containing protein [Methylomarinum vadi]|uniref:HDOD domain-containing protein n=1 Tax=Methylomarinum vadi TaxID=438855 RepID=UPI0004DFCD9C|nr:HDOD domain-containing protein [Methylomarinum vadi]